MKNLIILSALMVTNFSVMAKQLSFQIESGDISISTTKEVEVKELRTSIGCTTYSKVRLLGAPLDINRYESNSSSLTVISSNEESEKTNKVDFILNDDIEFKKRVSPFHYLHKCFINFKVTAVDSEGNDISSSVKKDFATTFEELEDARKEYTDTLDRIFFYKNKYTKKVAISTLR